jgi:hypothetical protein
MDYKYIEQLLERYWNCETSLEEEEILRTFFSQKNVPAALLPYKDLFAYQQASLQEDVLGDDFDHRILSLIEEPTPVKAKVITFRQRLMPLFKAAAVVAIFLTLGNALQVAFQNDEPTEVNMAEYNSKTINEPSVAKADSAKADSMQKAIQPTEVIIK